MVAYEHTPVSVDGKRAVVVGGTSGIGQAIALGFASEGADVVATSRTEDAVDETASISTATRCTSARCARPGLLPGHAVSPVRGRPFEYEIRKAKELGFNMLRKHIKPAHPGFRRGRGPAGHPRLGGAGQPRHLHGPLEGGSQGPDTGLIDRDYNSPSVVIWSLYNEEWGSGSTRWTTRTTRVGCGTTRRNRPTSPSSFTRRRAGPDPSDLRQLRLGPRRHRPQRLPRVLRRPGPPRGLGGRPSTTSSRTPGTTTPSRTRPPMTRRS